ncbi:hypothetical protein OG21DRAFT_1491749 [Imleria badia]|nr:hypothetical protein OG21DRAFT_1491749 [Imleria badia]
MVFIFKLLDDFIRDNLECGTSGSNYFNKLQRVTSNVFPHLVPWLLKLLKWNGFGHTSQRPMQGQLALFCPACPQPGVNCNPSEDELTDWKYTCTLVMDGNFKAEHMHEKRPEDQVWLMDGLGYMATQPKYKEYLGVTHHPQEKSTCYNHCAVNQANTSRGKLEATGIGSTACARHGCFVPHLLVDFQKGERQVNMDYSFANAIKHKMGKINRVISFYDMNCNYVKNLHARTCDSPFIEIPQDMDITTGIGIWHVHGHRAECFARHAPLFIPGAGWVDGEIIETLWSILNIVSRSTWGMSFPHRQELLNCQMNDANFMKMVRMTQSLVRKLRAARISSASSAATFNDLDTSVPKDQRVKWEAEEHWVQGVRMTDPLRMDIYDVQAEKGLQQCYKLYSSQANVIEAPSVKAMEIELLKSKHLLGNHATELQRLAVAQRVDQLSSKISAFLSEASVYLGDDHAEEMPSDESDLDDNSQDGDIPDDLAGP